MTDDISNGRWLKADDTCFYIAITLSKMMEWKISSGTEVNKLVEMLVLNVKKRTIQNLDH